MTLDEIISALRCTERVHFLTSPISADDLGGFESFLGYHVPDEYKVFLRFSNGAVLYESEELLGTARFWEYAETLTEVTARLRECSCTPLKAGALPFKRRDIEHYYCFDLDYLSRGKRAPVCLWKKGHGLSGVQFDSFEEWFEEELYKELHERYA